MKVYVGCGLTKAPEEFKRFVTNFKKALAERPDTEVMEFIGLTAGTATDVYNADLGNVHDCDTMIAIVDEPSLGLGMEIQYATTLKKPLLCLLHTDNKVTRMITGAAELQLLTLHTYTDTDSALGAADAFLSAYSAG